MKRICIITVLIGLFCVAGAAQNNKKIEQTIFAFGGDIKPKFVQYVVDLTNKSDPKVCYIPTASADDVDNIKYWEFICRQLSIESNVLKVWVSSDKKAKTFEEILLDMDAIVVGGGNTLNMMAIWKAQGIDTILNKALRKGIILAGGSAGSICWFQNGISDSRPTNLSVVNGLSILPYSNCPHYADSTRRAMYHQLIQNRKMQAGYGMDDLSGILFRNGKLIETVALNDINYSYYVSLKNGSVHYEKLKVRILIDKNAIPEESYTKHRVEKNVKDFPEIDNQDNPLNSYVFVQYLFANGQNSQYKLKASKSLQERIKEMKDSPVNENRKNSILSTQINEVLIYDDLIAGVVTKHRDFYGIWWFYKEKEKWRSAGEDIGGKTLLETEIIFRETINKHLKNVQE